MGPSETMLTVRQYAEQQGVSERTVQRWLRDQKLPGVVQTNKGWLIPRGTQPPGPDGAAAAAAMVPHHRELAVPTPAALPAPTTLSEALDQQPAFLALEDAARLLGISVLSIRRHAEQLGAVPYGPRGALVVPARTVRQTAGL